MIIVAYGKSQLVCTHRGANVASVLQALEPQRRALFLDTRGQALEAGPHGAPVNAGKPLGWQCMPQTQNRTAHALL